MKLRGESENVKPNNQFFQQALTLQNTRRYFSSRDGDITANRAVIHLEYSFRSYAEVVVA